ncbi:Spy0128 family protein [Parablautia muri]|uniref:Uncharacterized protein n=1 Tax=Parablautia muri TaxID=2320879 RepID=A0A9X5GTQ9_9FIRM|nr:FctA domain-containing protein [Parablautia muri]NBJ94449.1 hypothetical protein [Parablautia muri]
MKWVCKKNFKRCLSIALVLALVSPVNVTKGVFAANTPETADEEQVQVDETKHVHTFACYEGYTLDCTDEDENHVHGLECYTYPEGAELICSLEEGTEHIHNEDGFYCEETMAKILICQKEEHVHSEECYNEEEKPEVSATPTPSESESPSLSPTPIMSPEAETTPSEEPTQSPSASPDEEIEAPENTPEPVPENTPGAIPEETPDKTPEEMPDKTPEEIPEATSEPDEEPDTDTDTDTDTEDTSESDLPDSQKPDAGEDDTQTNENNDQEETVEISEHASLNANIPLSENPGKEADSEEENASSDSSDTTDGTTDQIGDDQNSDVNTDTLDGNGDEDLSDSEEKQEPICGMEEHVHTDDCYMVIYACRKAEAETAYEYAWNWADEKAQELESVPGDAADLYTMEYDSSKEWAMTLVESKQRMTVSLLEEDYLPTQIEAVRLEIVEDEDGEEVHETKEIMNVTWEIESGEFNAGATEGNIVILRAVQDVTADEADGPTTMSLTEDAEEAEDVEKIDFEMLPDIRMEVLLTSRNGWVKDAEGLKAAIANKQSPIILGGSFEVNEGFSIDYDLEFHLNKYTLTYNGTGTLFTVSGSGTLTIKDEVVDTASDSAGDTTAFIAPQFGGGAGLWGNRAVILGKPVSLFSANNEIRSSGTEGKITGTSTLESPIKVNGGILNVDGGTISFPHSEHGIYADGGTINIKGGRITGNGGNNKENGGGIYCKNAGLNIIDGSIDHNKAKTRGGGVYVERGSLKIEGGAIEDNEVETNGGGIFTDYTSVNIMGGTICNNKAKNGGGVYARYNDIHISGKAAIERNNVTELGGGAYLTAIECNLEGGSISYNKANENGGGIYISSTSSKLFVKGGNISRNTTSGDGGGVYLEAVSASYIQGGTIEENTADENGGGIYFADNTDNGSLEVSGGYIRGNKALSISKKGISEDGGGVNCGGGGIFAGGKLIISGGRITGNTAEYSGGGIEVCGANGATGYSGTLIMTGGEITNNTAEQHEGGGIRIDSVRENIITGGAIKGNETHTTQDWGGGGIFINSFAKLTVENAMVTKNSAYGYGGGVGGCTTSDISILTLKGPAIYDNTANGSSHPSNPNKQDNIPSEYVSVFTQYSDYFGRHNSIVFGVMLGGGSANWSGNADGNKVAQVGRDSYAAASELMGLKANPSAQDKAAAYAKKAVEISGNTSTTNGGGIMSNGSLIMGEGGDSSEWSLAAEKLYEDEDGKSLALKGGEFEFYLLHENPVKDGKVTIDETKLAAPVAKNDENGHILFKPEDKGIGTHTYYIVEKSSEQSEITYDNHVYEISVELKQTTVAAPGQSISVLTPEIKGIKIIYPVKDAGNVTGNTVTFTNTKKPTPTSTPSVSPSESPTNTPSASPSESPTNTPARTPGRPQSTPDETPAGIPTPSATSRVTPSATPTATSGVTPSATPTATSSASPSATPTATSSASPLATPTTTSGVTPSATPTATSGVTPSATPTATSSASPSATPTPTDQNRIIPSATPTASASASPSASATATPTASASASPSASATATPTASASASPSASATATPTASASASPSASATATPIASASASPSASATATPTASASASPSASATATPTASVSASPSASPTATARPDPRIPDSPDIITIDDDGVPRTYVRVWDSEDENWTYIPEDDVPRALPDPNDSDSPDKITIIGDEGVPKTYIKVADPDGEEEDFVYILDDGVPLGAPETADTSTILLWGGLCLTSVQGIVALWPRKKRKHEEDDE